MLVICEDCAKKYNIDESRIKGEKAKFTCKECGHIIVVEKPEAVEPAPETKPMADEEAMATICAMASPEEQQDKNSSTSEGKGSSTSTFFMLTIITAILIVGGIIAYMYLLTP
jgi:DNA-directed RNA polymerase subunit RPC12/RpoP